MGQYHKPHVLANVATLLSYDLQHNPMKISATLACLLLAAALLWMVYSDHRSNSVLPVTELPTTHRISSEEWGDLAMEGGFPGTGWVLLPEISDGPLFRSAVRPESRGFLPPAVCGECHAANYESFVYTAHAKTSMEPALDTILGSFKPEQNRVQTVDPDFWFTMTQVGNEFFQELHILKDSKKYEHRRPFGLVLGSGNHGQSYLYWEGDRLYQMHVSYLTELDHWVNSPGMYFDGTADFSRPVHGRCLDCHATWFAEARDAINRFDRHNYLLGVTCVRCHGPGHEHVAYHREFPAATEGKRIVNPSALSRERLNELCAQCHSAGEPTAPAFSYRPGEPLSEYLQLDLSAEDPDNDDPHSANQLARLMQSECYKKEDSMTCTSCHNPHRDQRGHIEEFSKSCLKCHTMEECGESRHLGSSIETKCIDCHMPSRRDSQVLVETGKGKVTALIRDHKIGVWPSVSDRIRKDILRKTSAEEQLPNKPTSPGQGVP